MNDKLRLTFFLGNSKKEFFIYYSNYIPRNGEEVRINNKIYKINLVVWCYDEKYYPDKINIRLNKYK